MDEPAYGGGPVPLRPVGEGQLSAAAPAEGVSRKGGSRRTTLIIASVVAVLALIAAGVGFAMRQSAASDLSKTKDTLATAQANLKSAQTQLSDAKGQVAASEAQRSSLEQENAALSTQVNSCQGLLQAQVKAFKSGHFGAGAANQFLNMVTECYGKIPPWFK